MKKSLKLLTALVMSTMMVGSLVGCGAKNNAKSEAKKKTNEPVEIKVAYWANSAEQKHYEFTAKGIEKEYPNIKVKLQQYPTSEEFLTAIPTAIAAHNAPDVIIFSDEGNLEYIANGTLAPLDDLIGKVGFDKNIVSPSLYKGWTYEEKLYGIPGRAGTSMLSVNKKMFENAGIKEYPKTMDEFLQDAKKLTKDGVYGVCANIHEFHITQYVHAFGGDWNFGKTINSPENVKGVQFFVDLFTKHKVAVTPKQLGASWDGEVFAKEKAAMSTGGPWYMGYCKETNPNLEFMPLPIPKGTVDSQTAYSGGFAILEQSEHKEEAMKFIKYALRDESSVDLYKTVGDAPSAAKILPKYLDDNPQLKPVFEHMEKVGMPFAYPEDTKNFNAELVKGVEEIIYKPGSKTVKQLLDELQEKFGTK
ncbi:ABC transporter substrate-binding protein [Clostridium ganghwense]|uniref:Sugar ABC transporter substrate-binding protein n=1 Tax=Clostridium ganghwense TaxID=312089 RepID=A0ABT4CKE3_9CLOT|nr:sugar ABC transporter substrate-binding protein [Clostridium ganghwense]MCY6369520.1 sugar ABC transporter substrate-binding protein [Clostridium ganghwense]